MTGKAKHSLFLALVLALGLAGCGSDDNDSSDQSSSPSDPNSPNPPSETRRPGLGADLSNGPTGGNLPTPIIPGISDGLTGVIRADAGFSDDPFSAEGDVAAFNVATSLNQSEVGSLAVTTTTFFCSSTDPANVDTGNGSITITRDDQDPAGRSTGDSVTETFNACTQFGRTINGTEVNTLVSMTGTPFVTAPWNMETTRTTNLTIDSAARQIKEESTATIKSASADGVTTQRDVSGTATATVTDANGTTTRSSTFSLATTTDLNTLTLSKTFDVSTSVQGGRSLSVKTVAPLAGSIGAAPASGTIEIREQDPTAGIDRLIRITAQPQALALVEVDENGDGTIDTTLTITWRGIIAAGNACINGCGSAGIVPPGAPGFATRPGAGLASPIPAVSGTIGSIRPGPGGRRE